MGDVTGVLAFYGKGREWKLNEQWLRLKAQFQMRWWAWLWLEGEDTVAQELYYLPVVEVHYPTRCPGCRVHASAGKEYYVWKDESCDTPSSLTARVGKALWIAALWIAALYFQLRMRAVYAWLLCDVVHSVMARLLYHVAHSVMARLLYHVAYSVIAMPLLALLGLWYCFVDLSTLFTKCIFCCLQDRFL
ncbi:hypothetical protein BU23DRAFT_82951 [Bimuria novae-zelandiae CBS 107.79]|uniref:Uncharacterized protein n=1 Tax=Bimuria novae-zelandiae CBS 107.79 TaxID=1447943 RepID=A0A6A5VDU9_9PLEO|nr:hypothetical protein BU23DRAFT_82951 [Bimuria novae-zelandiae CBS 107.79]